MISPPSTLVFALLAAFWAGTSAVFTGMNILIARKDAIETGKMGDSELNLNARKWILRFEWVPIRCGLGLVSVMLGIVILSLPSLAEPWSATFDTICKVASVVPLLGAVYFLLGGGIEYVRLMRLLGTVEKIG
ncbi:MAG TPA: hypothetical protein VLB46_20965 [Pyrinomonadaceae bacterium]|nr:hypothetical protein [Pyrinomonadaceae bacterium]